MNLSGYAEHPATFRGSAGQHMACRETIQDLSLPIQSHLEHPFNLARRD